MNLKLEVKLRQLLNICPQLGLIMEKYLLKMKEPHVIDVCKVTTMKIKHFDEIMLVVQVRVWKFGVWNVTLDGGFGVNTISENLGRNLG